MRIARTGCLGPCEEGPNLLLHPGGTWFHRVREEDLPDIAGRIQEIASSHKDEAGSDASP